MQGVPESPSRKLVLSVTGMHCAACAATIERGLRGVSGVVAATVNFATERADVEMSRGEDAPTATELVDTIERLGFGVIGEPGQELDEAGREEAEEAVRSDDFLRELGLLKLGAALALPLFALSMSRDFGLAGEWARSTWFNWVMFGLAAPVQILLGRAHYAGGWRALRNRAANMDVLVALGSTVAFGYSVAVAGFLSAGSAAAGEHVYFETAALILFLVRFGRTLELRARSETGRALSELVRMAPRTARVVGKDGAEREVPVDALRAGDLVSVRPGERVAADGEVVSGRSAIDESSITGEPLPRDKGPGDEVTGGTLNRFGSFRFLVERTGSESTLARIVAAVRSAQASRPPIQRLADRVAEVFVPVVLAVAVLTLAVWWLATDAGLGVAVVRSVAVLVVACPCAMGLATPTAVTVALGRGARMGILYRSAAALEAGRTVRHVALDKTGTVTVGEPSVEAVHAVGVDETELLRLAASAEARSEHPLARAIEAEARRRELEPEEVGDFRARAGLGVEAVLPSGRVLVGSARFLEEGGVDVSLLTEALDAAAEAGRGVLCVALDGAPAGLIEVGDAVAPNSAAAVRELARVGIGTTLLTGDVESAARRIAESVGIDEVYGGLLPTEKAHRISELRERWGPVAMVGDGINDAPALARADLGVAMGGGSDIAIESADVTLVGRDLGAVPQAMALSRLGFRTIRENLFWAFLYNVALIPIAAGALHPIAGFPEILRNLHPALAAGAMAISSVCVVGNSLRLRGMKLPARPPARA